MKELLSAIDDLIDIKVLIRQVAPNYELDENNRKKFILLLESLQKKLQPLFMKYLKHEKTSKFPTLVNNLKSQIDRGVIPEPDAIFIAGGSTGTAAGLIMGGKLAGLNSKIHVVNVYPDLAYNSSSVVKNSNKALKYLRKLDKSVPNLEVTNNDFEFITGFLGSNYAVKTKRGQEAMDLVMELEGKKRGFQLETSYTGKTLAAMIDFLKKVENQSKKVLFWNTYNSNDLDVFLKETNFNYKKLAKKFHRFFEDATFQCWQIADCSEDSREKCPAYLNHEYRFWKVTECALGEEEKKKARKILSNAILLEDA